MNSDANGVAERDARLDEVVADYLRAVDAGREPDRGSLFARHPDLADDLAAFFANRDLVESWAALVRETSPVSPPTCPHCRGALDCCETEASCSGCGARFRLEGPSAVPRPADGRLGRFTLLEEVGRGGF